MDLGAMLIGLLITFVIKVAVLLFASRLLWRLMGAARPDHPDRLWYLIPAEERGRARLLVYSLMAFFASELFCGIETWILLQSNVWMRYLHAATSSLGMGFFAIGMHALLDPQVLRYGSPPCLLVRVCRTCPRVKNGECRFRSVLHLGLAALILAPIPLFFAQVETIMGDTRNFVLPLPALNSWYDNQVIPWVKSYYNGYQPIQIALFLPREAQILEFRILPAAAMALAGAGLLLVRFARPGERTREDLGLKLSLFASGLLAYSYFELVCYRVTEDLFLGALIHELSELWFLLFVAETLSRFFPASVSRQTQATQVRVPTL